MKGPFDVSVSLVYVIKNYIITQINESQKQSPYAHQIMTMIFYQAKNQCKKDIVGTFMNDINKS